MPVKGLKDNAIKTSIETLNACLADLVALGLALKQAHWNVKGRNFIGIHELFDAVYARVADGVDVVAERVQILGGAALGTVEVVSGAAKMKAYPTNVVEDLKHVEEVSKRLADVGERVRKSIEVISEAGDEGTVDVLVGLSRQLDKDLWFVESHLGK
ncbi:MAG: DNA starvation/stationary phase protection protein Dps [Proteobacteria bacterium]|nr:DNA starvation/stationary phase protection protein Dps [Pseudomonadota bacterium]